MAVISWGKPKIEIAEWTGLESAGATEPAGAWTEVSNPKEDTTELTTTQGDVVEATGEGGERVDVKYKKSTFDFSFELYQRNGQAKPIADDDGLITKNYGVRLTPEDSTLPGLLIRKATVNCETLYSAADGKRFRYTFSAIKVGDKPMLDEYTAGA